MQQEVDIAVAVRLRQQSERVLRIGREPRLVVREAGYLLLLQQRHLRTRKAARVGRRLGYRGYAYDLARVWGAPGRIELAVACACEGFMPK